MKDDRTTFEKLCDDILKKQKDKELKRRKYTWRGRLKLFTGKQLGTK